LSFDLFYIGEPIPDISPELQEGQQPRLLAPFERFLRYSPASGKEPAAEQVSLILFLHMLKKPRFFSERGKKHKKLKLSWALVIRLL